MAKYEICQLLFCLHLINICSAFDPLTIGKYISQMKDENTKSISQISHLHCFVECIIRQPCVYVSSSYLKVAVGRDTPYRCFLYLSQATETIEMEDDCKRHNLPIHVIPKAVAGACSDHKCSTYDRCLPLKGGGYKCKPEKRRGNRRRKKAKHNRG